MKAPFVYFGGKRRVAPVVWSALGNVDNYVEPFAGSLAVLLERPHPPRTETVNDADGMLANFWRALAQAPEEVARWADWPVNEIDLMARHLWLVNEGKSRLVAGMEADPDFYDAKIAGWWVWGLNSWIGSGWCSGDGPWMSDKDGGLSKRPHLGDAGRGVNRKRPHLGNAGRGVNRKLPHLGNAGRGLYLYFEQLAARLRGVRVCCGDWSRVVTNGALSYGSAVGIFLDPPYLGSVRTGDLYASDDHHVANDVRDWCLANGENRRYRIVLAGYSEEHDALMPSSWRRYRYSASAAYSTTAAAERNAHGNGAGNLLNRHNECLWFSPGCLNAQPGLFSALAEEPALFAETPG